MLQDKERQDNLIGSDRVEGTSVFGADGNKIGSVENLLIDKQSGQVTDAVVSVGGFLGIGEERHSLPWSMLKYDTDQGGYRVNATEEQLKEAPRFQKDDRDRPYDGSYRSNVYSYWAV
ncbi:MAG: PRC-barrel domain-containing protein [Pseudomonadota bacterium]